jgi:hypothetical protein
MNTLNPIETNSEQITAALRAAMARHQGADWDSIDLEALAVLAQGRGDDLPPRDRARMLSRIAGDPDLGAVFAQLRQDFESLNICRASPRIFTRRVGLRVAWAASVAAMIVVGSVILADASGASRQRPTVEVLDSTTGQPNYIEQLGTSGESVSALLGNPLFVGLFVLTVLLGISSFWPRRSSRT